MMLICPTCGSNNDAATEIRPGTKVGAGQPTPGSIVICFYCGSEAIRTGDGLTSLTPELRAQLPKGQQAMLTMLQIARQETRRRRVN